MYIEKASKTTEELYRALQRLIPQLTTNNPAPDWDELDALVHSESATLLIARHPDEKGEILGILTLTIYRVKHDKVLRSSLRLFLYAYKLMQI